MAGEGAGVSVSSRRVEGVGGNRKVSPFEILRARRDTRAAGAQAHLKEGGPWGKHGFPQATEPKAENG
jgi:hypothetical protein